MFRRPKVPNMLTVQGYLLIVIIDHSLLAMAELGWGPPAFLIAQLKIEGQQPTLNDKCVANTGAQLCGRIGPGSVVENTKGN